jgi:hypothetical protein
MTMMMTTGTKTRKSAIEMTTDERDMQMKGAHLMSPFEHQ